jgi:hypothetical protein
MRSTLAFGLLQFGQVIFVSLQWTPSENDATVAK